MPIVISRLALLPIMLGLLVSSECVAFVPLLETPLYKNLLAFAGVCLQLLIYLALGLCIAYCSEAKLSEEMKSKRMQEETRVFDPARSGRNDSSKSNIINYNANSLVDSSAGILAQILAARVSTFIEASTEVAAATLQNQAEARNPPASPKASTPREQEIATKCDQTPARDDSIDETSTIYTPPASEYSLTSIMEDLEDALQEKRDLEAAKFDEEYKLQAAQLDLELAELWYENEAKWTGPRGDMLEVLEKCRRTFAMLEYRKKCRLLEMKRIDLDIEYLEKKIEEESDEKRKEVEEDSRAEMKGAEKRG